MFAADKDCYGAYKHIMSRLLHIQVGTNGSSIGWCCIGDATYETLWKLALSRGLRRARLFLGVWVPTKTTLVHTRVSPIAYYRYKIN